LTFNSFSINSQLTSLQLYRDGTLRGYTKKNVEIIQMLLTDDTRIAQDLVSKVTSFFGKPRRDMLSFLGKEDTAAVGFMTASWSGGDSDRWQKLPSLSMRGMIGDIVMAGALDLYRNELRRGWWYTTVNKIAVMGPWINAKFFDGCSLSIPDWNEWQVNKKGKKWRRFHPRRSKGIWNWDKVIFPGFEGNHWFLGIIDFDKKQFRYYDSWGSNFATWIFQRMQVYMFYTYIPNCSTTVHRSNSFCAHLQKLNI
jgi:hypothetical protein